MVSGQPAGLCERCASPVKAGARSISHVGLLALCRRQEEGCLLANLVGALSLPGFQIDTWFPSRVMLLLYEND